MRLPIALLCLALGGCASVPLDSSKPFTIFAKGSEGRSMDPLKFPKPLVTVRQPFPTLAVGQFAVRWDHYLLRDRYVLHEIVARNADGSYVMQGANRVTNPLPDKNLLTRENYVGIAFPLTTSKK